MDPRGFKVPVQFGLFSSAPFNPLNFFDFICKPIFFEGEKKIKKCDFLNHRVAIIKIKIIVEIMSINITLVTSTLDTYMLYV